MDIVEFLLVETSANGLSQCLSAETLSTENLSLEQEILWTEILYIENVLQRFLSVELVSF